MLMMGHYFDDLLSLWKMMTRIVHKIVAGYKFVIDSHCRLESFAGLIQQVVEIAIVGIDDWMMDQNY